MSTDNYYKNLWTNPNTEGGKFWKNVDFSNKEYKIQEEVFRKFLKGLSTLKQVYPNEKPIETVLEVGAGTGRMTKIVWEEFPDLRQYHTVDTYIQLEKMKQTVGEKNFSKMDGFNLDITSEEFGLWFQPYDLNRIYDFILASEVFMHIKPDDIESVLKRVTGLLAPNGLIINIDWNSQPQQSDWCFIHDYEKLYKENGLYPVFEADIKEIKQKLFCYGK